MTRRPVKKLLDVTSTKKRDTMVPANWTGTEWVTGSQVMAPTGGTILWHIWPATARNTSLVSSSYSKHTRNRKTIFVKGLKETVHMEAATNESWQWRRIVFSVKALARHTSASEYVASTITHGYMRGVRPVNPGPFRDAIEEILFQGTSQIDWLTSMVAPINTASVTLHSDVTRLIQSKNNGGTMRTYKLWTPINKSLIYRDQEQGGIDDSKLWSVDDKRGMGDLYVVDLFRPGLNAQPADVLDWRPNATLYWHEK